MRKTHSITMTQLIRVLIWCALISAGLFGVALFPVRTAMCRASGSLVIAVFIVAVIDMAIKESK